MKKIEGLDCILLVDDDPATNFFHEIVIKKMEWEVATRICYNAFEALKYLKGEGDYSDIDKFPQPGIILLDINMPGMTGWDFLEEYKLLPESQKKRIVIAMITSSLNPDDETRARSHKESIKEFINKPLTKAAMENILHRYYQE